mgnify:CR=1 FL=1
MAEGDMVVVHTYPPNDLIEHNIDDYVKEYCPCLPFEEVVDRQDNHVGIHVKHNAWDGRE